MMKKIVVIGLLLTFRMLMVAQEGELYSSQKYSIYTNKVVQGEFVAQAISNRSIVSNYQSKDANRFSPDIQFKFSINSRDNEMVSGCDHRITLQPKNGKCVTTVVFGQHFVQTVPISSTESLPENVKWTIRLDFRKVVSDFKKKGYTQLYNGEILSSKDFKGLYIAGSASPLSWDFSNLYNKPGLELTDKNGDGIYETTLLLNPTHKEVNKCATWELSRDISSFPQYSSNSLLSDAIYNMSVEEMIKAVEPDSTFRTGKEWAGVWTRDISYSIILAMAYLQPQVAKYSLLRKVKNERIIQDTGTGGAYPISTDRSIWAVAAWELYKFTGDKEWLKQAYRIIKKTLEQDQFNIYDPQTGLVKGESSFLDWREETYPRWMQPVDIFESECLGTNVVHFKANKVLAEMAQLMNEPTVATKYNQIAERIGQGINNHLWMPEKGYYGQFLYGGGSHLLSPRSESLGEALAVLFDVADQQKQSSVVENVPQIDFGIPCIYPQIPSIPAYHNNAIWPFVQAYWALASAKVGNNSGVEESVASIYRSSAMFLTNKENFVGETGDFAGTQINSSNMLWSLSGNLAIVYRLFLGMNFGADSLYFKPFVPEMLKGERSLNGFKYRQAILDISVSGFGNKIASFELDGIKSTPQISALLSGRHVIKIVLNNQFSKNSKINKVENYTTIETPSPILVKKRLSWKPIVGATKYRITKNGKWFADTTVCSITLNANQCGVYQVMAIDENNICSFASQPIAVRENECQSIIQIENYSQPSSLKYSHFQGPGFVEISSTQNRELGMSLKVNTSGRYQLYFRYSNGNGPVNTDNKCAMRQLYIDETRIGTAVFPQRGKDEWSNWGYSNPLDVQLTKGEHTLQLKFEESNENMNGDVNQAMLDALYLIKL